MYRFIGLRHEITEMCSINRKHRSNWTVTLILTPTMQVFIYQYQCLVLCTSPDTSEDQAHRQQLSQQITN